MTQGQLLLLVAVGGAFYIGGQYVASQPQRVEQEVEAEREITVSGRGTIQTAPDVATIRLGVQTGVQPRADAAIDMLSTRFQEVVQTVRELGVEEDDITTSDLSIQPIYDFSDGRQELRGYEASETITVKIRELANIGQIVARTSAVGVNQLGGLTFEIDDPDALQEEAQRKAIEDARENARQLADQLDVRLGDVKTFSSSSDTPVPPIPFASRAVLESTADAIAEPPVPTGSQEVVSTVTITYTIR